MKIHSLLLDRVAGSVIGLALLLSAAGSHAQPQAELPKTSLYAGMHRIIAEVASEPATRSRGLMWRERLEQNHGMLFIFPDKATHCFWMRNTLVPLSIAFLRDDGTIVNIEQMQPLQETGHCPKEPIRLALEVNQGWFEKRGISAGQQIRGLPATP